EDIWPVLASARTAIRPPLRIVVNNTFTKVWKPRRNPAVPGTRHTGPLGASIAYREYAFVDGPFGIGIDLPLVDESAVTQVAGWMAGIQYLGKRGSFMQLVILPITEEKLPEG